MIKGGGILPLSRDQCSFEDTGIYWYNLMKCCMVACINILYWENWLAEAAAVVVGGWRVGGYLFFTCFRPFGVNLQNIFFSLKILPTRNFVTSQNFFKFQKSKFSVKFFLQIDSKWSETCNKQKTTYLSAAAASTDQFSAYCMLLIQATIQHFIKIYK